MKTLFLHSPKFNSFYKPIGDLIWLNYMPMGLLAVADYINRKGLQVEVVHLGVEWLESPGFSVDKLVENKPEIGAVGLSLHWHHQAFDVIEAARRIKSKRKDIFVFLGGDTASFFHNEIIRDYPFIDTVVRGYGEEPVFALLRAVSNESSLEHIPNLTWRRGDSIIENALSYWGDQKTLNDLCYTNFSLLRNTETYVKYMGVPFFYAKRFSSKWNSKNLTLSTPVFPIPIGRGCPFNCSWCGGSQVEQRRFISGMKGFLYRSHDSVVRSVKDAVKAGYGIMQSAMDPEPESQGYFIELWHRMRMENLEVNWMFECNGLPSDNLLKEFRKTFPGDDSVLAISPECGNESIRLKHKGPGFTTKELFSKLDTMERLGIQSEIFFSYGLPGENESILDETISLQKKISKSYRHVRAIRTHSIEMEPGAPWFMEPEKFGIVTNRRCFKDFYIAHSDPDKGPFTSFGYYIPDYFRTPLDPNRPYEDFAERMQTLKCRRFCSIHPDPRKCGKKPWQGRIFCSLVSRLIRLKPRNLSRPY
jgi:radical SAM superfamily enzyme YgiQ (UPF0313 family)